MNDLETALAEPESTTDKKSANRKKANYAVEQASSGTETATWKLVQDGFEDTAKAMSWVKKMAQNRTDAEPAKLRIVAIKAVFTVKTETKTTATVVGE